MFRIFEVELYSLQRHPDIEIIDLSRWWSRCTRLTNSKYLKPQKVMIQKILLI